MIGRIAVGFKADLTLIDMNDPSWSPMNSAARQLVHVEAGRGVRTVLVDGSVIVRDRKLTSVDETTIYEAVKAVMPGFRKDFSVISARVAKLQPWLDRAHKQIMDAEGDVAYVVESGQIQLLRERAEGGEEIVQTAGPGYYFGELAPLFGMRRTATARAAVDSVVNSFTPHDLRSVMTPVLAS